MRRGPPEVAFSTCSSDRFRPGCRLLLGRVCSGGSLLGVPRRKPRAPLLVRLGLPAASATPVVTVPVVAPRAAAAVPPVPVPAAVAAVVAAVPPVPVPAATIPHGSVSACQMQRAEGKGPWGRKMLEGDAERTRGDPRPDLSSWRDL